MPTDETPRIGIIGAGQLGEAIARRAIAAGIAAVICNSRAPATLDELVRRIGPLLTAATIGAAAEPEIVVLAVPWGRLDEVFDAIPDWEGRIVVDATNPILPGGETVELGERTSSEVVADGLPGGHLVKAFNTLPASLVAADSLHDAGRRVVFVAGDHERSTSGVMRLVSQMGFAPVNLGGLRQGGAMMQFPGGPLAGLDLLLTGDTV